MYELGHWQLRWLGHDSFQLTTETATIYIDPYQVTGGRQAEYICISHEHYDHFDPESIQKLRRTNTAFFGPESVTSQLDEMAITLLPGETHETKDFKLTAVAAYNIDKEFHPRSDNKIGFILELDDQRLYHAGDSDLIPEMSQLGPIDVALLPVSGTYTMNASEAIEAVKIIKPKVAIPMHYGAIVGSANDAEMFREGAKEYAEIVVLEKEQAV